MAARPAKKSITHSASAPAFELPPGTPNWISAEMVLETLRVWQPKYQKPLTTEDAISILTNAARLLRALTPDEET